MASYVLVLQPAGQPPFEREFPEGRVGIGREVGDLVIPDPRCSSTHAELLFDGKSLRLRDLGSSNGTWSRGQRVTELSLSAGDAFQIGGFLITLKELRGVMPAKGRTIIDQPAVSLPPVGAGGYGQPPAAAPAYGLPSGGYGHVAPPPQAAHAPQGHAAPPAAYAAQGPAFSPAPAPKSGSNALLWVLGIAGFLTLATCGTAGACMYFASKGASATGGGATLSEPREQTVKFVWFAGEPGPNAKGGTADARIRVAPNKTGVVSVGVFEEFAGGGGNQWRTATWLAAFNASRQVGASLTDYEFAVHVGGHTDGPSAGMLTTATMLAMIRGDTIRNDTTMTGTVNPDGSAGPVGGIVQKIEGAKASGLKRFGFPIGCRNHKDMKTGNDTDLVTFGQSQGIEVKEISDLDEAYFFLTGVQLPKTEQVAEAEFELPADTSALIKAKLGTWKTRVDRELDDLKKEAKQTGRAIEGTAELLAAADKAYNKAKRMEQNGFTVTALDSYAEAAMAIAIATRTTRAIFQVANGQLGNLMDALKSAERVKTEVDAFGNQLEVKAKAATRGGQLRTAHSFSHYVTARSAAMIGSDFHASALSLLQGLQEGKVKPTNQNIGALLMKISIPTIYYDMARVYLDYARDMQDLIGEEGTQKPLDAQRMDRTVSGYASASGAVLEYFDALIVEELARSQGVTKDEAQYYIAQQEPEYYLARKANMLAGMKVDGQASDGFKLMKLSAAAGSYLAGGKLVNKHYSLGGHLDKQGQLVLENRKALSGQLDLARKNAREAAMRAKTQAGFIPTPAKLAFQSANADREGSDEEKLEALTRYWAAAYYCDLAALK